MNAFCLFFFNFHFERSSCLNRVGSFVETPWERLESHQYELGVTTVQKSKVRLDSQNTILLPTLYKNTNILSLCFDLSTQDDPE